MNIIRNRDELMSKVLPFLAARPAYSFIYDSQMVKISLNTDVPKYAVTLNKKSGLSYIRNQYTTAFVGFDSDGHNVTFQFNKYFAETLTDEEIQFIFCHEGLHVLLDHGKAGEDFLKSLPEDRVNRRALNQAMDVCINEILMDTVFKDNFKYMYNLKDSLCNIETMFTRRGIYAEPDKGFKYYYNLIMDNREEADGDDDYVMFGDMSEYADASQEAKDKMDQISEESGFTEGNAKDKLESQDGGRGKGSGGAGFNEIVTRFKKMNVEDAISRYIKPRNLSQTDYSAPSKVKYDWKKDHRRYSGMKSSNRGFNMPNRTISGKSKKMKVVVYCDVSGSVANYTKKFLSMIDLIDNANSEVITYAWADNVGIARKIASDKFSWSGVGHGTEIKSVFRHYLENFANDKVDAVVVLTDGEYTDIKNFKLGRGFDHTKWAFFMTDSRHITNVLDKSVSVEIDWNNYKGINHEI